jgi:outer membrane protein assembly factor BamB
MHRLLAFTILGLSVLLLAADWPAWRGPERTGVSSEVGLLKTWPEAGPNLLWRSKKAGRGYAGIAVVGGIVYTMGARDNVEYALAFDGKGNELWSSKIGPVHDWNANSWSHGPNATPTVDGGNVYALGSKGILVCVKKTDGKPVWQLDLPKELAAKVNKVGGGIEGFGWGFSWSPQIDGDKLVIIPGGPHGLFAALDKKKGTVLWRTKGVTDPATYSSPIVATIGGVKQYICLTQQQLVSVSAQNGDLLWSWKRDEPYPDVVCPTPIIRGDRVYISVGEGGGCDCFQITPDGKKFKATPVYSEKTIANKQGGVVVIGDYLYGYHEKRNWACQDFKTGKILWPKRTSRQSVKSGSVVAADGRLYVLAEAPIGEPGTAAMLDASPKGYKVISQFKLPEASKLRKSGGGVWTHPVLSDGKLYLRDQELLFCYQVK